MEICISHYHFLETTPVPRAQCLKNSLKMLGIYLLIWTCSFHF